jgi:hypothetical protein
MAKHDGFLILRNGIWDHVAQGKLSYRDVGVYAMLLAKCDFETGQWRGNAGTLQNLGPKGNNKNDNLRKGIQMSLTDLEDIGFIRSYRPAAGSTAQFGVLINKYEPQSGPHRKKRLDTDQSSNYDEPIFVDIEDESETQLGRGSEGAERGLRGGSEADSTLYNNKNKEKELAEEVSSTSLPPGKSTTPTAYSLTLLFFDLIGKPPQHREAATMRKPGQSAPSWVIELQPLFEHYTPEQVLAGMLWVLQNGPPETLAFWPSKLLRMSLFVKHFPTFYQQYCIFLKAPKMSSATNKWAADRAESLNQYDSRPHKPSVI